MPEHSRESCFFLDVGKLDLYPIVMVTVFVCSCHFVCSAWRCVVGGYVLLECFDTALDYHPRWKGNELANESHMVADCEKVQELNPNEFHLSIVHGLTLKIYADTRYSHFAIKSSIQCEVQSIHSPPEIQRALITSLRRRWRQNALITCNWLKGFSEKMLASSWWIYIIAWPSMPMTLPLIHDPSSEERNATTRATSMG